MGPFAPLPGKRMDGYYELPLDVLESREKLEKWGKKALAAAAQAADARAGAKKRARSGDAALEKLGPVAQRWLADAGIRTRAELERCGSVAAFRKVAEAGHAPSENLLFALEAALLEIAPSRLSAAVKQNLLERAGRAAAPKPPKPRAKRSR
jgi:hypothetical protein